VISHMKNCLSKEESKMSVQEQKEVGVAIVEMFYSLKDGATFDDILVAQKLVMSMIAAANDIKEDADSAILMAVSGASECLANKFKGTKPPITP